VTSNIDVKSTSANKHQLPSVIFLSLTNDSVVKLLVLSTRSKAFVLAIRKILIYPTDRQIAYIESE
jgi:hypothetical protein